MKNFTLRLVVLFFIATAFYGCETSNLTPSNCEFTEAEAQAYSNIAMKFSNNPTSANCATLRKASIDLMKKYENCSGATKAQVAEVTKFWLEYDCSIFN